MRKHIVEKKNPEGKENFWRQSNLFPQWENTGLKKKKIATWILKLKKLEKPVQEKALNYLTVFPWK